MALTFKSVGHFLAKAFVAIKNEVPKVEATKGIVELTTEAVPGGAAIVPAEDAAYALLGAFGAAFAAGGSAASAKLQDAGLDVGAIQKAEAFLAQVPQFIALAKTL